MARFETLKEWWYNTQTLFSFEATVGVCRLALQLEILDCKIGGEIDFTNILSRLFLWWPYKSWWYKNIGVNKNKNVEFELTSQSGFDTGILFYKSMHCNHTTSVFSLSLLGQTLSATYSDARHWDYDNNTYKAYPENK